MYESFFGVVSSRALIYLGLVGGVPWGRHRAPPIHRLLARAESIILLAC